MKKQLDKSKFIKAPHHPNEEALQYCIPRNHTDSVEAYRIFLRDIAVGDYIETDDYEIERSGTVDRIMRDKFGIPVCARVIYENEDGTWGYDMIPMNAVEVPGFYDWMCE